MNSKKIIGLLLLLLMPLALMAKDKNTSYVVSKVMPLSMCRSAAL